MINLLQSTQRYAFAFAILLASTCILVACSAPRTPPQAAYAGQSSFLGMLKIVRTYSELPKCSATVKQPCADQSVVDRLYVLSKQAAGKVQVATDATVTASASPDAREQARVAAEAAVALLRGEVKKLPATVQQEAGK